MSRVKSIMKILSRVLLGSAVAARTTAAPIPPDEIESKARDDWRQARLEATRKAALGGLPEEVIQYLPGEGIWDLDLPTSIRLSYAAARPADFKILDRFWSSHPRLKKDRDAYTAFEETRAWLSGEDGVIQRAETRQQVDVAMLGAVAPSPDFASPFDFVWPAKRGDGNDDDGGVHGDNSPFKDSDGDDDDDCDDDDCYDG